MDLFINKNFGQENSNGCSSVSIHFSEPPVLQSNQAELDFESMSTHSSSSVQFVDLADNLFLKCVQINDENISEKSSDCAAENSNCSPLSTFEQQSSESSAESVFDFNILNEFMNVQDLSNQQSIQYDYASSTYQQSPDSLDSNKPLYENLYDESDVSLKSTSSINSPHSIISSQNDENTNQSSVLNLNEQLNSIENNFDMAQYTLDDLFSTVLGDQYNQISSDKVDVESETLLNNIESMLNSLQSDCLPTESNANASNANKKVSLVPIMGTNTRLVQLKPIDKNMVKLEPTEVKQANKVSTKQSTGSTLKKISPKLAPAIVPATCLNNKHQPSLIQISANCSKGDNNKNAKIESEKSLVSSNGNQTASTIALIPNNTNCLPVLMINGFNPTIATTSFANSAQTKDETEPNAKKLKPESPKIPVIQPKQTCTIPTVVNLNQATIIAASNSTLPNKIELKPTTATTPSNSAQNVQASQPIDIDLMKKQTRMIRNRESACLSRKRKKEYMQTLEERLAEMANKNDELKKENQELKDKILILETENRVLKEQQSIKIVDTTGNQIRTLIKSPFTTKIINTNNTNPSLKRPFIMLAVFFIFGINMIPFISKNNTILINENADNYALSKYSDLNNLKERSLIDEKSAQLAALAVAQATDGALVDANLLIKEKVNSRHLLSDNGQKQSKNKSINSMNKTDKSSNELVLINGTWHLVNLEACYKMLHEAKQDKNDNKYSNLTHFNKINNELNGFFERQSKVQINRSNQAVKPNNKHSSSLLRNLNRNQPKRTLSNDLKASSHSVQESNGIKQKLAEYPISVYNVQNSRHETFAKSIRQRNDTFYYISFRRDHVIYAPIVQNKTQRPRISLILPALITNNLNSSGDSKKQEQIEFMQIDCEINDTRFFNFKLTDIPFDFIKILHQDFLFNFQAADEEKFHF